MEMETKRVCSGRTNEKRNGDKWKAMKMAFVKVLGLLFPYHDSQVGVWFLCLPLNVHPGTNGDVLSKTTGTI